MLLVGQCGGFASGADRDESVNIAIKLMRDERIEIFKGDGTLTHRCG